MGAIAAGSSWAHPGLAGGASCASATSLKPSPSRACAWTSGRWYFSDTDVREWDKVQNTAPDVRILTNHLVRIVKDQGVKTIFEAPENFNKQIMSI
jgi:hypothetical protein